MARAWEVAQAEFENWPQSGIACDGSAIRYDEEWGEGIREAETGMVISPVAYAVRRSLRRDGIEPFTPRVR